MNQEQTVSEAASMIASVVKSERQEQRLTQQQVASKAKVGLNFITQLEGRKETVQMDCVARVLAALGLKLAVLKPDATPNEDSGTVHS